MTFKTGDKVRFLNDVGGGTVVRVVKQTAYVETEDGFEIPVLFSELVKIEKPFMAEEEPEFQRNSLNVRTNLLGKNKRKAEPEEEDTEDESYPEWENDEEDDVSDFEEDIINSENSTLNILLGIVPVKEKGKNEPVFKVYLISDCTYRMMYTLSVVKENFCYGNKSGNVPNDSKVLVQTFTSNELRELQAFKINCIFYKKGIYLPHESLIYEYKIDLFTLLDPQNWMNNDYFDEKAMVINLTEESLIYEIERMVSENEEKFIIQKKKKDRNSKKAIVSNNVGVEEVDLHIEQLVDNFEGMSAGEIIDIQLGRFTVALEGAIRNNLKKIVFIHGVGNGRLKFEIRKALDTKYSKLRYQDASFKEYGYGATMVLLKK
jgi:hypothetical protein